jgi:hypothetical protein
MGYFDGRQKYGRPQGMMWTESEDTYNALAVPATVTGQSTILILSDHNRSPINVDKIRIETRDRMINGRMRSYHTADKMSISVSWEMLPSRAFAGDPLFSSSTGLSQNPFMDRVTNPNNPANTAEFQYTVDGGAGGAEILDWYENHTGPFWVYLAYDKYSNFEAQNNPYGYLDVYNEGVEMYFADFSYSIEKRGANNFDYYNVSVTLEEV